MRLLGGILVLSHDTGEERAGKSAQVMVAGDVADMPTDSTSLPYVNDDFVPLSYSMPHYAVTYT